MKKHDSYKDSGIEWIGEIPSHWEVKKVNYCFEQIGSGTTPTAGKPEYYDNGQFNWLQTGDLNDGDIFETSKKITQEALNDYSTLRFYQKESLVIAMYGATIGKTGLLNIETTTNQACCVLSKPKGLNNRFAFYWLNYVKPHLISLSYGGGQPNINQEQIRSLKIQCPTPKEQTAIAAYLDRKTAEIDELIADKKRLLELYEEEKTAIINQAVTKGINPDVPMKDSGIEWLGEIPEHWEVKRLKHLTSIISKGTTPSTVGKEVTSQGDVRFIKAENIVNNQVYREPENYIDNETNEILSRSELHEGDILFVIAGATLGKIAILNNDFLPANTNQAISFIRLIDKSSRVFLWYYLQSLTITRIIWLNAVQSAQPNLSMENLGNFYIPYPSSEEQQSIVRHIKTECALIDAKRAKTEKLIELLTEYRTALISEVVTGKIKVIE